MLRYSGGCSSGRKRDVNVNVDVVYISMWPLLKRDGMGVQYVALTLLWNRLVGYNPFRVRPESFLQYISLVGHALEYA